MRREWNLALLNFVIFTVGIGSKTVINLKTMLKDNLEVSVIIPAYNEAEVIATVITQIKAALDESDRAYEILVIDDGCTDETAARAKAAGAHVLQHAYNIGNGAAIKTGIRNARGEIIVMLDADGQHPPKDVSRLLEKMGRYDMIVGARTSASDTDIHRNVANQIYNWLASYISGQKIEDLTSGFRAIKTNVARGFVYLLPNQFSYPTTITLAVLRSGRSLAYIPINGKRRVGKSNIRLLRDGIKFLLIILRIATFYSPLKIFVPVSASMFLLGLGYGLFKILALDKPYGPTSAMLMTISIVIFMVGLVSEQVALLRFEHSEMFRERD